MSEIDLARRLVAAFPQLIDPPDCASGIPACRLKLVWTEDRSAVPERLPDLHDPVTGGVLYDMLREAVPRREPRAGWDDFSQEWVVDVGGSKSGPGPTDGRAFETRGPTLAIAVGKALLEIHHATS